MGKAVNERWTTEEWKMKNEKWKMENEKWRVKSDPLPYCGIELAIDRMLLISVVCNEFIELLTSNDDLSFQFCSFMRTFYSFGLLYK